MKHFEIPSMKITIVKLLLKLINPRWIIEMKN